MEYPDFKRHLGKAGLTIREFADLLGVRPESISNYASKEAVPRTHAILAVLFGEAADNGIDFRQALVRFGAIRFLPTHRRGKIAHIDDFRHRVNERQRADDLPNKQGR